MSSSQKILAILELESDADLLTERTAYIANTFGCDVHLVLFDPDVMPLLSGTMPFSSEELIALRDSIDSARDSFIDKQANKIREAGIQVTTSTISIRPLGEHILSLAQEIEPKIIVKATRCHSTAERSSLFDSDWELLRTCPYPLWLVKQSEFPERPTIAAAVDPMHEHDKPAALDHEIIETANLVAHKLSGDVRIFHAYQTLSAIGTEAIKATTPTIIAIEEVAERIKTAHMEALTKLASAHDAPADSITMQAGRTHDLLPTFVRDKKVSLLIMGGISRWGIKRAIVGSTAERVMDHIPCDILILRIGMHPIAAT